MIMSLHDAAETHTKNLKEKVVRMLGSEQPNDEFSIFFIASPKKLFDTESTRIDYTGAEIYWSANA